MRNDADRVLPHGTLQVLRVAFMMIKSTFRKWAIALFAVAVASVANSVTAAAPIYKTLLVLGVPADTYTLTAFNNQDDILGTEGVRQELFIYQNGVYRVLPRQGAPEITASGARAMNNADANGVVRVIGTADVTVTLPDGGIVSQRGACWLVPSNSVDAITEESMPNHVYPDSQNPFQRPGEAGSGAAYGVNDAGEAIGTGFWQPNGYGYGNAQWGVYNNQAVEGVDGIDDFGNYFVNRWSWDSGLPTARLSPLIGPSAGELPGVDTPSGTNSTPLAIHGGFVVGSYAAVDPRLIGTVSAGLANRAFVWQVGDARLTELPDPVVNGFSGASINSVAQSVNNAGDAVGVVTMWDGRIVFGYATGYDFLVLWKRTASGGYTAYNLSDIVSDESLPAQYELISQDNPPLINDKDEIALGTKDISSGAWYITVLAPVPGTLTEIGSFSESPGGTPVRSSNPWQFTAYYTNIVSDLRLRVQSTTTTNSEASWTDLPGNPHMTDKDGNWTLNTTDLPTGTRYFRVIASAPGYFDTASVAIGPETVLDGIAPFGLFTWETTYPTQTGVPWRFTITEASLVSDLRLRIQSSPAPGDLNSWTDLPGGGQMGHQDATWALNTTNLPTGTRSFRVVAAAPTYVDRISTSLGPLGIRGALPPVMKSGSTSATYTLDNIMEPDPQMVYFEAISSATLNLVVTGNFEQFSSALTLAGQQYAAAVLQIEAGQNVGILAVNMGQNSTLILKGAITGDVSLISQDGSGLISQDGAGVISHDGGSLTFDAGTAAVVSNDGGSLVSNGSASIIGENSSGLIGPQHSGTIRPPATVARQGRRAPQGPPFQPTFTGLMTIHGNYSQFPGATLVIGIAGANTLSDGAQQFDQLVVSGTANLLGGTIAFGLFNPNDQTNQAGLFQPPDGATFDVVVATNIVVGAVQVQGPIWGDGLFFSGSVVTRTDGLQAVRLVTTHVAPRLFLQTAGAQLQLVYPTNYTGYTVESTPALSPTNWTAFSTGTNLVVLNPTNTAQFFRLVKP